MDTNTWIDRLYADTSITDGLAGHDAEQVLSWAENHLATCESEQDALHLFNDVRLLSRYVHDGGSFEQLFAALRASALQVPVSGGLAAGEGEDGTDTVYPLE